MSKPMWFILGLILGLCLSCGGPPRTPETISATLNTCLRSAETKGMYLWGRKCQCVKDAVGYCRIAGLPDYCGWDGWHDKDDDAFGIAACKKRLAEEGFFINEQGKYGRR